MPTNLESKLPEMTGQYSGRLPPRFHTVTDERVAALLTTPGWARFYEPFLARSLSVMEAATEAGCTLDQMLYRVRRMVQAGLLKVEEVRQRKGRPIKVYRTAYDAYFIPYNVTPFASNEEHFRALYVANAEQFARRITRRLQQSASAGRRLYRTEHGEVWIEAAPDTTTPSSFTDPTRDFAFDVMSQAYLPDEIAREVQADLSALMLKLRPYTTPNGSPLYALTLLFMRDEGSGGGS